MKFSGSEDPMFSQPFTVVDRKGAVWTVATDKVWLVASRGNGTAPRFKGESEALFTVLKVLHYVPTDGVILPTQFPDSNVCSVLGVTVSTKRLQDLVMEAPAEAKLWSASGLFPTIPGIGISCDGWMAMLMGFTNVIGDVPVVDLSPTPDLFDLAMGLD